MNFSEVLSWHHTSTWFTKITTESPLCSTKYLLTVPTSNTSNRHSLPGINIALHLKAASLCCQTFGYYNTIVRAGNVYFSILDTPHNLKPIWITLHTDCKSHLLVISLPFTGKDYRYLKISY